MFDRHPRAKRLMLALSATGILALGLAAPVGATGGTQVDVTQEVTSGTLSASLTTPPTFSGVTFSHANQDSHASMTLTAGDSTDSGDGWNVTISSGDFAWDPDGTGATGGTPISADNFSIDSTEPVVPVDGVGDAPTAPEDFTCPSLADDGCSVLSAAAGAGNGDYTEGLNVTLVIPANSTIGKYTATVTTSIVAGP